MAQDSTRPIGDGPEAPPRPIEGPESAGRLLAFLDTSFDALYDWHLDTGYLSFNNQIDELLGHPPGTFPRSFEGWLGEIHPDDRAQAVEGLDQAREEGIPFRTEYRFRHRDGHYIMVDDHGVFVPDETGRITHMVGAMRDVTRERAAERALRESESTLREQARALEERNTALRVLVEQRDQDRRELEERIQANVERLIRPTLDRLRRALGARPEASLVETLTLNLEEIVRPYASRLAGPDAHEPLTRRELEICNLIRIGRTTVEIADALHISHSAVSFHRGNIRRKLGLSAGGPHLTTHLASLAGDAGDAARPDPSRA